MRLTPRLILPTLLALSLAACKGDDDEPVDDSTITGPEDCFTQGDEEQDGLADCADDDCLDGCLEDCIDTVDNDADGAIDCDDDECQGAAGCGNSFTLKAKVTPDFLQLMWGPGLIYQLGIPVLGQFSGEVKLYGTPVDPSGPSFSCAGAVYAYPTDYNPGHGSLDYVGGDCGGCDLRFEMTTTVNNGGLRWQGSCPVTTLAFAELGFFTDRYEVTRYDPTSATWSPQYGAGRGSQNTLNYGHGLFYLFYMKDITQLNPVVWEESL